MRRLVYQAPDGQRVILETPWGDGSGNIPPPVIRFHTPAADIPFVYVGVEGDI